METRITVLPTFDLPASLSMVSWGPMPASRADFPLHGMLTNELDRQTASGEPSSRNPPAATPAHARDVGTARVADALNAILADVFALYLKTRSCLWHMTGPHFYVYHNILAGQSEELLAMTDPLAQRVRGLGARTLHSIGQVARIQRFAEGDGTDAGPSGMLAGLREDNLTLVERLREFLVLCAAQGDIASACMAEDWIERGEGRSWLLCESVPLRDL